MEKNPPPAQSRTHYALLRKRSLSPLPVYAVNYLHNMIKHFIYRLTGTGWAEATFTSDKQSITFDVSYLTDPLSDLFEALHRLLQKDSNSEKVFFADEPGAHSLVLTTINDAHLKVEIY